MKPIFEIFEFYDEATWKGGKVEGEDAMKPIFRRGLAPHT